MIHGSVWLRAGTSLSSSLAVPPYRCLSALKLKDISQRFDLFGSHSLGKGPQPLGRYVDCVVDLAASPGGFSQVSIEEMLRVHQWRKEAWRGSGNGRFENGGEHTPLPQCISFDLRPMQPLEHCTFHSSNVLDHAAIMRHVTADCDAQVRRWTASSSSAIAEAQSQDDLAMICSNAGRFPQGVLFDGVSVVEGQSDLSVTYAQSHMALATLRLASDILLKGVARFQQMLAVQTDTKPPENHNRHDPWTESMLSWHYRRCFFVSKLLQCPHADVVLAQTKRLFHHVSTYRPSATKSSSLEVYVVARGLREHLIASGPRRFSGFSLPPLPTDLAGSKRNQVMWYCFGCRSSQMGARPCTRCNQSATPPISQSPRSRYRGISSNHKRLRLTRL